MVQEAHTAMIGGSYVQTEADVANRAMHLLCLGQPPWRHSAECPREIPQVIQKVIVALKPGEVFTFLQTEAHAGGAHVAGELGPDVSAALVRAYALLDGNEALRKLVPVRVVDSTVEQANLAIHAWLLSSRQFVTHGVLANDPHRNMVQFVDSNQPKTKRKRGAGNTREDDVVCGISPALEKMCADPHCRAVPVGILTEERKAAIVEAICGPEQNVSKSVKSKSAPVSGSESRTCLTCASVDSFNHCDECYQVLQTQLKDNHEYVQTLTKIMKDKKMAVPPPPKPKKKK
jgi:hypothetical protein